MNFRSKILEIVGGPYRHALFYRFPGGLRFELSEGGSPLDDVLTALRKATLVCEEVFRGEEKILVHLVAFAPPFRFGLREVLRELRIAGIVVPKAREVWLEAVQPSEDEYEPGEDSYWINCAFEVYPAKLQNLLWCAITSDFVPSLGPNPDCQVYLLNLHNEIVVHPYDDRGMDVISRHPMSLVGLYEQYNDLLFDFNMEAMRETFARFVT